MDKLVGQNIFTSVHFMVHTSVYTHIYAIAQHTKLAAYTNFDFANIFSVNCSLPASFIY